MVRPAMAVPEHAGKLGFEGVFSGRRRSISQKSRLWRKALSPVKPGMVTVRGCTS